MSRAYFLHVQEGGRMSALEFTRVRPSMTEQVENSEGELVEEPVWTDPLTGKRTEGAKQSFRDECDINRIVQRFDRDGVFTHLSQRVPHFTDVTEIGDFKTMMDQVGRAAEFFREELPASVRAEFGNNPTTFLDALFDPSQKERLEELGILPKKAAEAAPTPAPAAPTQ